jgi:hypothetical protein
LKALIPAKLNSKQTKQAQKLSQSAMYFRRFCFVFRINFKADKEPQMYRNLANHRRILFCMNLNFEPTRTYDSINLTIYSRRLEFTSFTCFIPLNGYPLNSPAIFSQQSLIFPTPVNIQATSLPPCAKTTSAKGKIVKIHYIFNREMASLTLIREEKLCN